MKYNKHHYLCPRTELTRFKYCQMIALSTNDDDDERAPQSAKEFVEWEDEEEDINGLWEE